ncbi:putative toxin-antitoxin system toxin component, PIN family [Larkinella sp. VNQ87]|uniref:putative toxin-antitoxin system toxin component, PIN family n=1 Tax=Larkinella sp. VNQ87 TaxID=3400921 RepID=UPI003C00BAC1
MKFLKKVEIRNVPDLVRDANDNYLLGVCEACQADFLVTGDMDLLLLENYQNTKIVTMAEFLQTTSHSS